jgi:hypothetical protein
MAMSLPVYERSAQIVAARLRLIYPFRLPIRNPFRDPDWNSNQGFLVLAAALLVLLWKPFAGNLALHVQDFPHP